MINLTSTTFFTDEDGEIETKSLNSIIQIILPLVRIFCGTFLHICRRGSCYKMLVLAYCLVYYIISVIFFSFLYLFVFRSTYRQFVQEIIIEQCKGTKSGKDSKEFDVDHVRKLEINTVCCISNNLKNTCHIATCKLAVMVQSNLNCVLHRTQGDKPYFNFVWGEDVVGKICFQVKQEFALSSFMTRKQRKFWIKIGWILI